MGEFSRGFQHAKDRAALAVAARLEKTKWASDARLLRLVLADVRAIEPEQPEQSK